MRLPCACAQGNRIKSEKPRDVIPSDAWWQTRASESARMIEERLNGASDEARNLTPQGQGEMFRWIQPIYEAFRTQGPQFREHGSSSNPLNMTNEF